MNELQNLTPAGIVCMVLMIVFAVTTLGAIWRRKGVEKRLSKSESLAERNMQSTFANAKDAEFHRGRAIGKSDHLTSLQNENDWLREAATKQKPIAAGKEKVN